jgi:hypothetical protein
VRTRRTRSAPDVHRDLIPNTRFCLHVEGEGFRVGVVVPGIAFQGEGDGGQAVALGILAGGGAAAVDVQGWHAVVPVAGFLVEEQLDPQRAHRHVAL